MPQATIHVPPQPYQAWIETGLLTRAGSFLADLLPQSSRIFVVTVPPVGSVGDRSWSLLSNRRALLRKCWS